MSDLYETIKQELDKIIAEAKLAYSDKKLSLSEVWGLFQDIVVSFMKIAETLDVPGEEKKQMVLDAASRLYDEVIAPIDIKTIPNVIEPAFDRFGKSLFMELIGGSIDYLVKFVDQK